MTDPSTMSQGLLARNPALTLSQFSEHWYKNHGAVVVPLFLYIGVRDYVQIHGPLSLVNPSIPAPDRLNISHYDGCAMLPSPSGPPRPGPITPSERPALQRIFAHTPSWAQAYYHDIVLADERRFLVSLATEHIMRLPPNTVKGEPKIVIRDGDVLIPVPESVWDVWRLYERRGAQEEAAKRA